MQVEVVENGSRERKGNGEFLFGHPPLPGCGRPAGSRAKLAEAFISDLHRFWQASGTQVIEEAARQNPAALVTAISRLLPRDVRVQLTAGERLERILKALEQAAPKTIEGVADSVSAEHVEQPTDITELSIAPAPAALASAPAPAAVYPPPESLNLEDLA